MRLLLALVEGSLALCLSSGSLVLAGSGKLGTQTNGRLAINCAANLLLHAGPRHASANQPHSLLFRHFVPSQILSNILIARFFCTFVDYGILDLNDGKNFTTMEWLMVFVKVPL